MKLSKRLSAVAAMVTPGMTLADIGTDHAYIPIDLVERGVIPRAIAADVHPGPLLRAQEHIRERGLADRICTRLSDGLLAFAPDEAQSIVIAGMGGALTVRILQNGAELFEREKASCLQTQKGVQELILQPQSEIAHVRAWLWRNGWEAVREDMVFEDGKYYPMMKAKRCMHSSRIFAVPEPFAGSNPLSLEFGSKLLEARHPVLREYLQKEKVKQEQILTALAGQTGQKALSRAQEIRQKLALVDAALSLYDTGAFS
ncbi:MAG: class I SAM-dependent methyltransferase [Lachnospiraceae bacterium]|nr:class I SAM-dependent methyltransferase [Lachnospiraceae bacterium]